MRRIRDVLRLKYEAGLSERAMLAALGISKGAIGSYLSRARAAGLSWPLPEGLTDTALERRLFPGPPAAETVASRSVPDWAEVERELRRRGVTRALLWQEYRARHPDGFGYSWFCEAYEAWKARLSPRMRQSHVGGEKVFVDFAGDTIGVTDPASGVVWQPGCSWRRWAPPTWSSPVERQSRSTGPARGWRTGSGRMSACSRRSVACRSSWSATT